MSTQDFYGIIHQYLLQNPYSYACDSAYLVLLILPSLFAIVCLVIVLKDGSEPWFCMSLFACFALLSLCMSYAPYAITDMLYPSYAKEMNRQTIDKEMTFIKKCHLSQCLMAPGINGNLGLGARPNDKIDSFIYKLADAYYGYQFVSGQDVFEDEKRTKQNLSYNVRLQSLTISQGHVMLFIEVEHDIKVDGFLTGKGIYEVPVYQILSNLRETHIGHNSLVHEREAAYQNSIGK